jgi:FemAB-related protein (PEP-CTERM system-associated)
MRALTISHVEDAEPWDRFVSSQARASYAHLAGWRTLFGEVLGHECPYLVAMDAHGEWQGVLPLVWVRSRLFGRYLVSLPVLSYGGPLGTEAARSALAEAALHEARSRRADLLELRCHAPLTGDWHRPQRRITVTLDLPGDIDTLFATLPSRIRTGIRKATKDNLQIRHGYDQVEAFYQVHARVMRDLGSPVLPRAFFARMPQMFPESVLFSVVYLGNRPIAGQCAFEYGCELETVWGAGLTEFNRHKPMSLVYWTLMERAVAKGRTSFNFGRCPPGSGTHAYKLNWGGRDTSLNWVSWSRGPIRATPSGQSPAFRLATALWRHLPVPLATAVGSRLARRLP